MSDNYLQFEKEALSLVHQFPTFELTKGENGVPEIIGTLFLNDEGEGIIDSYGIRIVCPWDYPSSFPIVYETGGRIPINIDWHVYADGHACLCTIPEEIITCSKGITLEAFFLEQITPYFFNQKYREMHGYFLTERAHGLEGNQAYFKELFKTESVQEIAQLIRFIVYNDEPDRVADCFCGSGAKYRRCHREAYRVFKPLPLETIARLLPFIRI